MTDFTASFGKPFAQQIAAWRIRLANQVPTATWDAMWHSAHDRAFTVAGALKADLLADLAEAVDKAITNGGTLESFRQDFRAIVEKNGWHGWAGEGTKKGEAWRTKVIYKTNLATSYAAGRWAQLKEAGYGFLVYRHGGSLEPRVQHLAWDGLVLEADHPFWATHAPPNGWGCSCYVTGSRTREGAKRVGGQPGKDLPDGWQAIDPRTGAPKGIDRGWAYAPGASASEDIIAAIAAKRLQLPEPLAEALAVEIEAGRLAAEERAMEVLIARAIGDVFAQSVMAVAREKTDPRLTVAEKAAIVLYTGNSYKAMNRALREVAIGRGSLQDPFFKIARVIDRAMVKLPKVAGPIVRGLKRMPRGYGPRLEALTPGDVVAFRGFTSGSRIEVAAFSGPVQFRIVARTGRAIDHLSLHPQEMEVLLGRGLQFRVTGRTFDGLRLIIDLEELPPGDWTRRPTELMSEDLG
jgi:hypothetical protein